MRLVLTITCVCACSVSSGSGAPDGGMTPGDASSGSSSGGSGGSSDGSSGSSSGSSGEGGGTSFYCSVSTDGGVLKSCTEYLNVPANDVSGFTQSCTFERGTVVSSCPSTDQVGCCRQTADQVVASECFYCGPASTYESACTSGATWTAGDGGAATCETPD